MARGSICKMQSVSTRSGRARSPRKGVIRTGSARQDHAALERWERLFRQIKEYVWGNTRGTLGMPIGDIGQANSMAPCERLGIERDYNSPAEAQQHHALNISGGGIRCWPPNTCSTNNRAKPSQKKLSSSGHPDYQEECDARRSSAWEAARNEMERNEQKQLKWDKIRLQFNK